MFDEAFEIASEDRTSEVRKTQKPDEGSKQMIKDLMSRATMMTKNNDASLRQSQLRRTGL